MMPKRLAHHARYGLVLFIGMASTSHAIQTPTVSGQVDLTIGAADGPDPVVFGRIGGLDFDRFGHIYVADELNHDVRVFGETGEFLFSIGRRGDGPGDLKRPCCIAVHDSHLWVLSVGARRYDVFTLYRDSATFQARHWAGTGALATPPVFDSQGVRTAIGVPDLERVRRAIVRINDLGEEVSRRELPSIPMERLKTERALYRTGGREFPIEVAPPFGPDALYAFDLGGRSAVAVTDEYLIRVYTPDGDLQFEINQPIQGPVLARTERDSAQASLRAVQDSFRVGGGHHPDFDLPFTKPPIQAMWFDRSGELWIRRSMPYDAIDASADVYDTRGRLVLRMTWPRAIRFERGVIRDNVGLGIVRDSLDVERVVRVRFGTG